MVRVLVHVSSEGVPGTGTPPKHTTQADYPDTSAQSLLYSVRNVS